MKGGSFWFDVLCFMAWIYVIFHMTEVIAFVDRLLAR